MCWYFSMVFCSCLPSRLQKVKKVIGIELCEQAVEDARHNAEANGMYGMRVLVRGGPWYV